jgi:hypothetical protein
MLSQTVTHEPTNTIIILKILKIGKRHKEKKANHFSFKKLSKHDIITLFLGSITGHVKFKEVSIM